jgi:hypothetical protein
MSSDTRWPVARRSFVSRLAALGAAVGFVPVGADAATMAADEARWQPARHEEDDWLEQIPGKHRLFFDTTTPDELEDAIMFAGNFFMGNKQGYGLEASDLAVVICMRHRAAPFGYNDAMWAKHHATLGPRAQYVDPKTSEAPTVNIHTPAAPATGRARGFAALRANGVRFAVCNMSTNAIAGLIARRTGVEQDAAYAELKANLIPAARLVPAGIVAKNRAQERGYSIG